MNLTYICHTTQPVDYFPFGLGLPFYSYDLGLQKCLHIISKNVSKNLFHHRHPRTHQPY